MRTIVFGAGALGCYLAHALVKAGNDVCVVARGAWGQTLARDGLQIHHVVQLRSTCDHPQVVGSLAEAGPADVLFAVMQQGQMLAALSQIAAAEVPLVVLVGNSLHVDEELAYLAAQAPDKTVLFGFQATAGRREADHVEDARLGRTRGPLEPEGQRAQLAYSRAVVRTAVPRAICVRLHGRDCPPTGAPVILQRLVIPVADGLSVLYYLRLSASSPCGIRSTS